MILKRIKAVFSKRRFDSEMEEEIRSHVEMRSRENMEAGMSPEEARYAALKQFGWAESIKEQCREERGISWLENGARDVRFAVRRLIKDRGFTWVALATLTLCIGANAVIYSFVDGVLIRPLPFPESDRLVCLQHSYPGAGVEHIGTSIPNYYDWKKEIRGFESVAAIQSGTVVVGAGGTPARVISERVTPEFFGMLGVQPAMGQFFTEAEMESSRAKVVVLSDNYWRSKLNADPQVVGRSMKVDGETCVILGVLPRRFQYLSSRAELYFPLTSTADERRINQRHSDNIQMIARLGPGVSVTAAQAQIDAFDAIQLEDDPYAKELKASGARTSVYGLHADHVHQVRPTLLLLQAGALVLLLVGGINLLNLTLIRATGRSKENAVRLALGASRGRLACGAAVEGVGLAMSGGILGLFAAASVLGFLDYIPTTLLPFGSYITLNMRVVGTALGVSFFTGLLLAAPTIWGNRFHRMENGLKIESRTGTSGVAVQRLRHGFLVAQISLALVLLTGAGLLGTSLKRVLEEPPGFQPEKVVSGQVALPLNRYRDPVARRAFMERVIDELRGTPGMGRVAISTTAPFIPSQVNRRVIAVEGRVHEKAGSLRGHYIFSITGDLCQTLGVPLLAGRYLEARDYEGNRGSCLVDEAFAKRYWPQGGALGRRLAEDATFQENGSLTIVGVVGEIKQGDLADTSGLGTIYRPYRGEETVMLHLLVRSVLKSGDVAMAIQNGVRRVDPELPVDDIQPMQSRIDQSVAGRRSPAFLSFAFAAAALILVAVGTYGVVAYSIAQRHREIGVRMALGALPGQVIVHFLMMGVRMLALGILLGVPGAWFLGMGMASQLFRVSAFDFQATIMAMGAMIVVVLTAALIPSRRAAFIDPIVALRHE